MQRSSVVAAALWTTGFLIGAAPLHGQTTLGADLDLFSAYVWRGLTLTNKPVAEPALYLTFPVGNAEITAGGWANIELGQYDGADDISQSEGASSFDVTEFDPYAEVSFPAGQATLTGGVIGYLYPNDAGLTEESNTVEVYGKVGFDVPLSPELSIYYDVDKINGAYIEGGVSHSVGLGEKTSLDLGALAGFSAGQGISDDPDESSNFADDGFTHLDLSAGVPFTAGAFSITPVIHFQVSGDELTKFTGATEESDLKVWGGVSLSWSAALGDAPEEETEE